MMMQAKMTSAPRAIAIGAVRHMASRSGNMPRQPIAQRNLADEARDVEEWWANPRWSETTRPYTYAAAVGIRLRAMHHSLDLLAPILESSHKMGGTITHLTGPLV